MDELEAMAEFERDTAAEVIRLLAEGKTAGEVSSRTAVPPRKQREIKQAWYAMLSDPRYAEGRSKQLIGEIDEQYSSLIRDLYLVIDEADNAPSPDYKTKKEALKEIANIHKMRAEIFLKAGLINKDSIGDDIAMITEKLDAMKEIIKKVAKAYPPARQMIEEEIAVYEGRVTSKRVDN